LVKLRYNKLKKNEKSIVCQRKSGKAIKLEPVIALSPLQQDPALGRL
jgi:hypothetical protein